MRTAALLLAGTVAASAVMASAVMAPAYAQQPDHVAMAMSAEKELKPDVALQHYQAALAADSMNFAANWRGAVAAVQVAQLPSSVSTVLPPPAAPADTSEDAPPPAHRTLADSMYALAEKYARRAVEANKKQSQGHFAVAFVLGSKSMVSDPLTKLSMAREIHDQADTAISLDPKNDAAYHILGQWNAEIMRLSKFERGYAEDELGDIAQNATWDIAIKNLEKAATLAPSIIYHHLDLARAYTDAGRPSDAKAQIAEIDKLPNAFPKDADYKNDAKALLTKIDSAGTGTGAANGKQP